jgi:tetratricopeptide (TPR) repeat protein
MQYIIITLLSIVISTVLIFLLTNRLLNIHLKIKPLVLCACCAFLINIVLPRIIIGFASVAATLGVLVIFIIAFAYSIAYYNDKFSKQKKLEDLLNQPSLIVQVSTDLQERITIENHNTDVGSIAEDGDVVKGVSSFADLVLWENPEIAATVELCDTALVTEADILGAESIEQILIKESEIIANCDSKDNIEEVVSSLESQLLTSSAIFDEIDRREVALNRDHKDQPSDLAGNKEIVQTEHVSQLATTSSLPISSDLDSLMDLAFMHKEQRNFTQALTIFRQALTLYPSSEAAPFLVMEIGTILKNNGQYDEAISAFCEARILPGLQQNEMFQLEFIKTIAYLRIVKNMLLQHHLGFIPFSDIPDHVLKEVDAEFREWRNPM